MNDMAGIQNGNGPEWLTEQLRLAIARAGDLWTVADLVALAKQGQVQIWYNEGAVAVTELASYPRRKIVNVFLVAGRLAAIRRLEPIIEVFARSNGATAMRADGREAWGRVGAPMGWHPYAVTYVKIIANAEPGHG